MKYPLLALLSLAIFSLARAQEDSTISQDYLIRLQLNIADGKIPDYLIEVIYQRPLEKRVSSQAVLDLYRANTINLTSTLNILQLLNISQTQVFSINGLNYTLDLFNWTFTNFYTTLTNKLNLAGLPLRNALIALQINATGFSEGIAYGDPDPWQEFIKGNFTEANLESACAEAGITLNDLWVGIRDLFINDLVTYEIRDFVKLLVDHTINQPQALVIWNAVPVTLDHVYSLALFNEIITNFTSRINSQVFLGVLTSLQQAVIHRVSYDVFNEEKAFLDIQVQPLLTRGVLPVNSFNATIYKKLVVVEYQSSPSNNLTVINVGDNNSNTTDCSYVTFQNNNILTVNVPSAIFFNETYVIARSIVQNVISGSALVCNGSVYGLVREAEGDSIIVDTFSEFVVPPPDDNSGHQTVANAILGLILLITHIFNF